MNYDADVVRHLCYSFDHRPHDDDDDDGHHYAVVLMGCVAIPSPHPMHPIDSYVYVTHRPIQPGIQMRKKMKKIINRFSRVSFSPSFVFLYISLLY